MKIKHVWHCKPPSQTVHAFVPLVARRGQRCRSACGATGEAWPILAPNEDGKRCKACVSALARREAKWAAEAAEAAEGGE